MKIIQYCLKMHHAINSFGEAIIDLLLPPLCFYCNAKTQDTVLCLGCYEKIHFLKQPRCLLCQKRNSSNICQACRKKNIYYDRLISVTAYSGPIKLLIHYYKYAHHYFLADFLADLINNAIINYPSDIFKNAIVTAVPAHPKKIKERGYNQSNLLAKKIANNFKIPFKDDIIYKIKNNVSQTMLKKSERPDNVKDTFIIKDSIFDIDNLILFDDIFTTGATVNECAKSLKARGIKNITVITLAKTIL